MSNSLKTYYIRKFGQMVQVDICSDGYTYFIDPESGEALHSRETIEQDYLNINKGE